MTALFTIQGVVQGVGFRAFVRDVATADGWAGEVWNTRDGRVEALITCGSRPEEVAVRLRGGPGRVNSVTWIEHPPFAASGFRIGYTR